jgi:hypothetical protein
MVVEAYGSDGAHLKPALMQLILGIDRPLPSTTTPL